MTTKLLQFRTTTALRGLSLIFHDLLKVSEITIEKMKIQTEGRT